MGDTTDTFISLYYSILGVYKDNGKENGNYHNRDIIGLPFHAVDGLYPA